ncbi:ATP-binding protein [Mycobacterium paraense]|uniref:ATP-binding protein n=1 Tax=Mycobacterium paraense TaxID=767916 RepID=UPI001F4E8C34|nr:adenylate/guanylate cyclase domain-containing protein [Mycobacterium paraense]
MAEFKQVTVLVADVVHSMDIAAAVGAERLREILSELLRRWTPIIHRYGGTLDKFTGDGVMALFGAPEALEDHAFRACLAALDIQRVTGYVADEIARRDGVVVGIRLGLNSGRVVTGDIASSSINYTAIGEEVGLAQRMEAAAPPGGVMLSASTARLVQHRAILAETQMLRIKGATTPVPARLLLGIGSRPRTARPESALIGREPEIADLSVMLDDAIGGTCNTAEVVGVPGIGKSRLIREAAAIARRRGVDVFTTVCEAHMREIAFHALSGLLREIFGINGIDEESARQRMRAELPTAQAQDLRLLEDLLGISGADIDPTEVDSDARRRRIERLLTNHTLQRQRPGLYIIEDSQWIDAVSDSILVDLISILQHGRSLILITHRPEYRGALTTIAELRTITLPPLDNQQCSALVTHLVGSDESVTELAIQIAERASGNPFFAEEIVHDFAEQGVLSGTCGSYRCLVDTAEINVPVTVEAILAARIDRLSPAGKRTLNAAAVIGSRFDADLLSRVLDNPDLTELIDTALIERAVSTTSDEYVLRHPLIRAVVYESQLHSVRSHLHRKVAAALEERAPSTAEESAALIATHLEAAGDLRGAFSWYMRAGNWLVYHEISAARASWQHALDMACRLPIDSEQARLRITALTPLCATAWRIGIGLQDTGFDELAVLTVEAGDTRALAIAVSGQLFTMIFHTQLRAASRLASEYLHLLESTVDDALMVELLYGAATAKWQAGEALEANRMAQRIIDLADGSPAMTNAFAGSPLALAVAARGAARASMGQPGWKNDFDAAIAVARKLDTTSRVLTVMYKALSIGNGLLVPDEAILRDTAEVLVLAEQSGDDLTLANARMARGVALIHLEEDRSREQGFELLNLVRDGAMQGRITMLAVWFFDVLIAREQIRSGNVDLAVELSRRAVESEYRSGEMVYRGLAACVLVEALLARSVPGDLAEAQAVIDELAAVPTDPGFVLNEISLHRMRALLARASAQQLSWAKAIAEYRALADAHGFEGHVAAAKALAQATAPC